MKNNLIISLAVFGSLTSALAQGQITFSAVGSPTPNYIQYGCVCHGVQKVPAGDPAQVGWYGDFNLTLYGAPVGTTLSMSGGVPNLTGPWKPATRILHKIGPAEGVVIATIFQMEPSILNAAGEFQLIVVAWTGKASNFNDAARGGGIVAWTGSSLSGGALTWKSGSGSPWQPYVIDKGPDAFNGLVLDTLVPEPSPVALVGLGAAAWLLFRVRIERLCKPSLTVFSQVGACSNGQGSVQRTKNHQPCP